MWVVLVSFNPVFIYRSGDGSTLELLGIGSRATAPQSLNVQLRNKLHLAKIEKRMDLGLLMVTTWLCFYS